MGIATTPACPYNVSSIYLILTVVKSNRTLELTKLVQTCPEVCNVVFGYGNPDLTGIGLFVTYGLQLGLLTISVLLYLGTHYKSPLSPAGAHFLRQETISKLQSLLAETTAYFTVTVVISCFARLLQTPTIYEIVLIPAVMGFEVYLQTMHILASLSIPPPNTQQPISPRDWGWMEQNRSIAIHTVYIVVNVIVLVLAQIIGFSERGLLIIFNIAKRCDAYASLPAYRLMSSQFLRGHLDLIVNNVSFSLPPWVLIIWLLLCRTQLGARLAAAFPRETTPRGHIDTSSSMCSGAKRSSAGASGCLRVGDFLSYRNSFRTLYRNGNIVLQAILILGVHLTRWYFLYLYCICSMMVVTILHATLDPIFRRWISMPRFYSHIVSQANHCDQWVETLAVDYRLIGVPRLIFATIFIWPIVDTVSWFMYISNMRLMLHKQSQGTDMQNEWGVGQVAAVIAWLPLLTKIIVLGYNRWRSQTAYKSEIIPIATTTTTPTQDQIISLSGVSSHDSTPIACGAEEPPVRVGRRASTWL